MIPARDADRYVIALDVGGSSVKHAAVTVDGQIIYAPQTTPIDNKGDANAILGTFADIIRTHAESLPNSQLMGIGVGMPGPFDYETGVSRIQGVDKFESIYGLDIGREVRTQLRIDELPIRFRNDAEAAIMGEALFGAGEAYRRILGITLGTGIGSAFLIDGEAMTSGKSVPPNGWLYAEPVGDGVANDFFCTPGLMNALHAAGVETVDIKAAADLARADHAAARRVFAQFGSDLGKFLQPWAAAFRADAILVQGGIANAFDLFGPNLSGKVKSTVVGGALGSRAALLGAAALLSRP